MTFKHILLCPTQQDYNQLMQWFEENTDLCWTGGSKPTEYNPWNIYKEETAIRVDSQLMYATYSWCKAQSEHKNYTFQTAQEFLTERTPFRIGQKVRLKGGVWWDEKNVGKTGTYYGIYPNNKNTSLVVFEDGVNQFNNLLEITNGQRYDYGETKYLEAVEENPLEVSTGHVIGESIPIDGDSTLHFKFQGQTLEPGILYKAISSLSESYQPKSVKEKVMNKLSELEYSVRKSMSEKQKALFQMGYKDSQGKWTDEAHNHAARELREQWLEDNKEEMAAMAKEELQFAKEDEE